MNREQIEELLKITCEIIDCMDNSRIDEAYRKAALTLTQIQQFMMLLLDCGVLEQDAVLVLLTDLVEAIEKKDEVLLSDIMRYGINTLLQDILRIMEEDDNE